MPLESLQSSFNVLGISHALAVDTDGKLERCTERFGSSLHSVVATPITGERMDQWLNDGPGLVYVKELCTWVVVNNKAELISWTADPAEIAWLSLWVQYKATIKEVDRGTDNRASKAVGQRRRRVSTPKYARPAPWFTVAPSKKTKGCHLKPLRTLESKRLKLSVTAANESLKGFAANSLPLVFMT